MLIDTKVTPKLTGGIAPARARSEERAGTRSDSEKGWTVYIELTCASAVNAHIKRVWRGVRNQAQVIGDSPPNPSALAAIGSKRRYRAARSVEVVANLEAHNLPDPAGWAAIVVHHGPTYTL